MALLIDGYNLLHHAGIFGQGRGGASLHRSREALLRFLANSIPPAELARTTIVFDSTDAPPGLPKTLDFEGITVHFAADYADADAQIEELILANSSPRSLVVVSSDHRIQRAARRRRAKFFDSEVWYADIVRQRQREGKPTNPRKSPDSDVMLTEYEVDYWLTEFGIDETSDEAKHNTEKENPKASEPAEECERSLDNPFPPDYADDLLEGDDLDDEMFF